MAGSQTLNHEIRIKIADRQLEFLENRVKELGLSSKTELIKWYIITDMAKSTSADQKSEKYQKKRVSLRGIISGSTATDADFEEAKNIWKPKSL